jgi:hypothetical protein
LRYTDTDASACIAYTDTAGIADTDGKSDAESESVVHAIHVDRRV